MKLESLVGQSIDGRYDLIEHLGSGAMGVVYRAHQSVVNRTVAIKILHPVIVEQDPEFRKRFEREAQALGRLDHPNCVRVFEFGWWHEMKTSYMVTEFAPGRPLYYELGGNIPTRFALEVLREIALGLAHAHSRGVLHRDLKPENVMVDATGSELTVKVVDFGLAHFQTDDVRLTKVGSVHGTPAYMSPEQCKGDDDLTDACDVYALGCMAFELLDGELPYDGDSASGLLIKHVTAPVPRLAEDISTERVRDLVARMMRKDPSARPPASEVAALLGEELGLTPASIDPRLSAQLPASESVRDVTESISRSVVTSTDELAASAKFKSSPLSAITAIAAVSLFVGAVIYLLVAQGAPDDEAALSHPPEAAAATTPDDEPLEEMTFEFDASIPADDEVSEAELAMDEAAADADESGDSAAQRSDEDAVEKKKTKRRRARKKKAAAREDEKEQNPAGHKTIRLRY